MEKRRTILIVILSLFLAALIVAVAVFGVSLSRSAYSDESETYASEARWKIEIVSGDKFTAGLVIDVDKMKPDFVDYSTWTGEGNEGARTKEWFGPVAILENTGELKADVTASGNGTLSTVKDGCPGGDDDRYTDDEVAEHVSCLGLYYYEDASLTMDGREGWELSGASMTLDTGEYIYIYAHTLWTTDLEYDMNDTIHGGYDGALGDEFDTWAGEHVLGITFHADFTCTQAE